MNHDERHSNFSYWIAISAFIIILSVSLGVRAEEPPPEVMEAATKGLPSFLRVIPSELIENYGFSDKSEFEQVKLGNPYHVYTILPEVILDSRSDASVSELISPVPLWFFPVVVDGKYRVFLKVGFKDGEWKAFGIGMSVVAEQLASAILEYPPSQGFEHTLVIVYQAGPMYFTLIHHDKENQLVPLGAGPTYLGLDKANVRTQSNQTKIISRLQEIIRNNLNQ